MQSGRSVWILSLASIWLVGCQADENSDFAASERGQSDGLAGQIEQAFAELDDGSFEFSSRVTIVSADGTEIVAKVLQPTDPGPGPLPAVIFVNSWASNEYQYLVPAARLAKKGYIALSYATRGFGSSGGLVNVAGPDDMADLSAVIDWLEDHTAVDVGRIGMAGISYGAGISLSGLAHDDRIKTAVAMSGWGSLADSLYGDQTPRLVWGLLLLGSGYFTGRMDPNIGQNFDNLLRHRDIEEVLAWADQRSPAALVDRINAGNKPVYISNNLSDTLFNPNQILDFYQRITSPKKLDLNRGSHATAEILGLVGAANYVWDNAYDWFDYWLRDRDNGVMDRPRFTIEDKLSDRRLQFEQWPVPGLDTARFYLRPRTALSDGDLELEPSSRRRVSSIYAGHPTFATTGIPLISEVLDAHLGIPVDVPLSLVNRWHGLLYWSDRLTSELAIRGRGTVELDIESSAKSAHVVVYLYDANAWGKGTLISHGTATLHDMTRGQLYRLRIELQAVAHDIPPGHRVVMAIDSVDPLYATPTPPGARLGFAHGASPSDPRAMTLELETLP